ncbi:DUF2829 domain-containing protein [Methylobacterium sp. AMS5]|uniref:DUF2829 domain-containing protein n=1 Tax=Methylobacterium sp. AMS5 TaxID=925818 RepID=UPI00074F92A0|nr:DUF2829 domain-containing protein [Methylobacterium sp. AMS5]AMB48280.1 hypothetical protein Y590_25265 [Methylobacterium sp. AMS5]
MSTESDIHTKIVIGDHDVTITSREPEGLVVTSQPRSQVDIQAKTNGDLVIGNITFGGAPDRLNITAAKILTTPAAEAPRTTGLRIGEVVEAMQAGKRVARAGWNGKGMYLELQVPDAHSKMSLPYVFMFTACKNRVPWLCSQSDLLAQDWEIVS